MFPTVHSRCLPAFLMFLFLGAGAAPCFLTAHGQESRERDRSSDPENRRRRIEQQEKSREAMIERQQRMGEAIRRQQRMGEPNRRSADKTLELFRKVQEADGDKAELMQLFIESFGSEKRGSLQGNLGQPSKSGAADEPTKLLNVQLQLGKIKNDDAGSIERIRELLSQGKGIDLNRISRDPSNGPEMEFYNELTIPMIEGEKSKIVLGEQVAVRRGSTSRGGQQVVNVDFVDVGFSASLLPRVENGVVMLQLEISKSYLDSSSSDSDLAGVKRIENYECETTLPIGPDSRRTVMLSNGSEYWLLTAFVR